MGHGEGGLVRIEIALQPLDQELAHCDLHGACRGFKDIAHMLKMRSQMLCILG
jgi:hypothetical protein